MGRKAFGELQRDEFEMIIKGVRWFRKSITNTQNSTVSAIPNTTTSTSPYGYSIMGSTPITFRREEYDIDKHKGHFITLAESNIFDGVCLHMGGINFRPYCLDCKEFIVPKGSVGMKQDLTNGKGKEVFDKEEVKLENEELKAEI